MTLAFTIVSDVVSPASAAVTWACSARSSAWPRWPGPLIGGYFAGLGSTGWRWIFYINVPLAILAVIVCNQVLRIVPFTRREHKIDWLGAGFMVGQCGVLLAWRCPSAGRPAGRGARPR